MSEKEIAMLNDIDLNATKTVEMAKLLRMLDDNETAENIEQCKNQRQILIESIVVWCMKISAYSSAMIIKNGGTK